MIRRALVWLVPAVCLAVPARAQDPTTIRVNVRLVLAGHGEGRKRRSLIGSLNKSDFSVFDNGVQQEIAVFERQTEQPLSIALMVDTSASTGIELRYELDSVGEISAGRWSVEGNPEDAAALYSFNWQTTLLRDFTRRFTCSNRRCGKVKTTAEHRIYDAIYLVSRELRNRDGRHVIVIVTDGGDTTSTRIFMRRSNPPSEPTW